MMRWMYGGIRKDKIKELIHQEKFESGVSDGKDDE